jgi:protein TonB
MPDRGSRTSPNACFLRADPPVARSPRDSLRGALSVSVLTHVCGFLLFTLAIRALPVRQQPSAVPANPPAHIIWLAQPGPPRGGGDGEAKRQPAGTAELPGREALTVPATTNERASARVPRIEHEIQIPAVPMMAGVQELPGIVSTLPPVAPGSPGSGAGDRAGQGSGPGDGSGLGPGSNGGTGGDAYQSGNGVVAPRLIRETKPAYTADAMRARVQGVVRLQAIVLPDGSVGPARVVRSLDATFGLDDEALNTVRRWRFVPGTLAGRAVPVLVEIELAFTLR